MPDITPDNLESTIRELMPPTDPTPTASPDGNNVNLPGLGEFQEVINFVTTFEQRLKGIVGAIQEVQSAVQKEKSGQAVQEDSDMAPTYKEMPVQKVQKQLSPIKVYQALLKGLTMMPKEMTVGEALERAKSEKENVLMIIRSQADNLYED